MAILGFALSRQEGDLVSLLSESICGRGDLDILSSEGGEFGVVKP